LATIPYLHTGLRYIAALSSKYAVTEYLAQHANVTLTGKTAEPLRADTPTEEYERVAATSQTALPVYYKFDDPDELQGIPINISKSGVAEFLINVIHPPRNIGLRSELTATLQLADAVLLVVDVMDGWTVQAEAVLRQALSYRIKPVLMIDGLDRVLLELQHSKEDLYQILVRIIESINAIIGIYAADLVFDDFQVSPDKGSVAFGSILRGWAFTVPSVAEIHAKKLGMSVNEMKEKLWVSKKWCCCKTKKLISSGRQLLQS
jgi:elongation factor 2